MASPCAHVRSANTPFVSAASGPCHGTRDRARPAKLKTTRNEFAANLVGVLCPMCSASDTSVCSRAPPPPRPRRRLFRRAYLCHLRPCRFSLCLLFLSRSLSQWPPTFTGVPFLSLSFCPSCFVRVFFFLHSSLQLPHAPSTTKPYTKPECIILL